jgi:RNA recognition motif-containing protein
MSSKRQRRDDDSDEDRQERSYDKEERQERSYDKEDDYQSKRKGFDGDSREEKDKRTVFVGKLSDEVDEEAVKKIFKSHGNVLDVRFIFHRDRSGHKGCAFVEFEKESEAQDALKENDVVHHDQALKVTMAGDKQQKNSIFVGNLSYDTTEDSLKSLFEKCGKVERIYMPLNEMGKPKGFAFIDFTTKDALDEAVKLNGSEVDKRDIRVEVGSKNRSKGGFRGGSDRGGGYRGSSDRRGGYDRRDGDYKRDSYRRDDNYRSRDSRDDYKRDSYSRRDDNYRSRDSDRDERRDRY